MKIKIRKDSNPRNGGEFANGGKIAKIYSAKYKVQEGIQIFSSNPGSELTPCKNFC